MRKTTRQLIVEGENIKFFRQTLGLTQKETAHLLNCDQGNYSNMEQGRLNSGERYDILKNKFLEKKPYELQKLYKQIEEIQTKIEFIKSF